MLCSFWIFIDESTNAIKGVEHEVRTKLISQVAQLNFGVYRSELKVSDLCTTLILEIVHPEVDDCPKGKNECEIQKGHNEVRR